MKNKSRWVQGISLILALIWMAVIFGFSAQNGEQSAGTSGKVVDQVAPLIIPNYDDLSVPQQLAKKESLTYFVRKFSHFSEYAVLGFLVSLALPFDRMKRLHSVLIAFGFCVLYAISDEIHQIFSGGRTPAVKDVLIDSSGGLMGVLFACLLLWFAAKVALRRKNRKMKGQKKKDEEKKNRTPVV